MTVSMNSRRTMGSSPEVGSSSSSSSGSGQIAAMRATCVRWPLESAPMRWAGSSRKRLRRPPSVSRFHYERREARESSVSGRVESEDAHAAAVRAQEVEQAFHGGGLAGAVAAEQAVTTARLNGQVEIVHRFSTAVGVGQAVDLDDGSGFAHAG